jgi:glutaredoxin 3
MAEVKIYSSMLCGFCWRAKALLDKKGIAYEEVDVTMDSGKKKEMTSLAGGRTSVPQIFIDGAHVGGCDELYALDGNGRLDQMLGVHG